MTSIGCVPGEWYSGLFVGSVQTPGYDTTWPSYLTVLQSNLRFDVSLFMCLKSLQGCYYDDHIIKIDETQS